MEKRLIYGTVYRTVALAILIYAADFILNRTAFIHGTLNVELSFMFYPLVVSSVIFCAAAVSGIFLTGELADPAISSTKIFAVALFFSLIMMNPPTPKEFQPVGFWLLVGGVIISLSRIAIITSGSYRNNVLKVLFESASLFAVGYVLSEVSYIVFPHTIFLAEGVFYSFVIMSALSLLGIFRNSRNPYLSYVGKKFGGASGKASAFLFAMILLFYFYNLRPVILNQLSTYIIVTEWIVFCLASFIVYRTVRSYVSKSLVDDLRLGNWTAHLQKIVHEKDKVEAVSKIAEKFVEEGFKEGMLVYLISTLVENDIFLYDIEGVIEQFVEYEDLSPPKLMLHWKWENLKRENKTRRIEVLMSTICKTAKVLGSTVPSPVLDEKELKRETM